MLADLIERIFGKTEKTGSLAKDRLRVVLASDRSKIPPEVMDKIRIELIQVLSKYLELDDTALNVSMERDEDSIALVVNTPVHLVREIKVSYTTNLVWGIVVTGSRETGRWFCFLSPFGICGAG